MSKEPIDYVIDAMDKFSEVFKGILGENESQMDYATLFAQAGMMLREQKYTKKSPCTFCRHGGKHLDAPPCINCPAIPKTMYMYDVKSLTVDELMLMHGKTVYIPGSGWALVDTRNNVCETLERYHNFADTPKYWKAYTCEVDIEDEES